jgi:Branched-chain amino acid transport system / permease component
VASTLGVNVTRYKLLAFATGGLMAGVAGALFAHWNQAVQAQDFVLQTALVWVLMSVIGGLGSRAGVVIGSAFFALFPLVLADRAGDASIPIPFLGDVLVQILTPFFGALLLLLTITLYPGGIGQQILPLRRWLAGGLLVESRHDLRLAGLPLLVTFLGLVLSGVTWYLALAFGFVAGLISGLLLLLYLRRAHRALATQRRRAEVEAAAETVPVTEQTGAAEKVPASPPSAGVGAGREATGETRDDSGPAPATAASEAGSPAAEEDRRPSRFAGLRRRRND